MNIIKRLFLILPLGVLWCIPAQAIPAYVQSGGTNNCGTCNVTLTLTAGNSVYVSCGVALSAVATCTVDDDKSDSFSITNAAHVYTPGALSLMTSAYFAANVAGGSTVLTCHASVNIDYNACTVVEFSGADTFDKAAVNDNPSSQMSDVTSGPTATTTAASEILIGFCYLFTSPNSLAATGSWTLRHTESAAAEQMMAATQVVSSTGTTAATFAETDRDTICNIATFKASGGGGASPRNRGLLGVGQ